ncbi:PREDICTED: uncharacterized protein LOC106791876 [Polistes canadensis]|uniref:uncharacterized protein LOC106791876 n=1 Tax=Polistes canadensis TaxID=91411 RepID=UPI000718EB1A|nr:PREDICTED: uncharacterized protein LOC106791876 [Polistes canadensis]XP_014613342.1 PREDICTED: uncharacterized protein LOC106791876 [Polistes canadensis]XP_014613343.1 PREDICTED: uncharacterized protein LOC106791876 [Polistes canadensis]
MLKHILTGQPSSAGSRHHHNDYQTSSGSLHAGHHHHHQHNLLQQEQQPQPQQQQQQQQQQHHYGGNGSGGTIARGTSATSARTNGIDVYDSVVHSSSQRPTTTTTTTNSSNVHHQAATTPSSAHRHPLNHSQLSVNNLSQRLNHSHALNLSTLSTSKHSVNSVSPVVGGSNNNNNNGSNNINGHNNNNNNNLSSVPNQTVVGVQLPIHQDRPKANGGFDISRLSRLPSQTTPSPAPAAVHQPAMPVQIGGHPGPTVIPLNASWSSSLSRNHRCHEAGVKEMLTSLGLLCLVSLLLALLSLIFLLKISPLTVTPSSLISPEEYTIVYEVTLALCALALSLNLCCLLVCAIQFLFAVKLVKTSYQGHRSNKYLQKSSISRVCAVGGFFISIPVFLTGMILYTFIQFHSTPAIVTSVFIGLGIVFCGCAMVHNVFVWQREKTNAVKALAREQCEAAAQLQRQQQQSQQNHHHHHHQSHLLQQQQHQQHQQHQHQLRPSLYHSGCAPKIGSLTATHSNTTLPHHGGNRSSQYHQPHQHHHHHHHHRHLSSPMSPPLLLSSTSAPLASTHSLLNVATNRSNVVTPPATPGDRSPPSPTNKFNRSHITREASGSVSPGLPAATLDLSSAATTNSPHELSTLV